MATNWNEKCEEWAAFLQGGRDDEAERHDFISDVVVEVGEADVLESLAIIVRSNKRWQHILMRRFDAADAAMELALQLIRTIREEAGAMPERVAVQLLRDCELVEKRIEFARSHEVANEPA